MLQCVNDFHVCERLINIEASCTQRQRRRHPNTGWRIQESQRYDNSALRINLEGDFFETVMFSGTIWCSDLFISHYLLKRQLLPLIDSIWELACRRLTEINFQGEFSIYIWKALWLWTAPLPYNWLFVWLFTHLELEREEERETLGLYGLCEKVSFFIPSGPRIYLRTNNRPAWHSHIDDGEILQEVARKGEQGEHEKRK